jgi:hypothetical protein
MPYRVYKDKSDRIAEKLAKSGVCYLSTEKIGLLREKIEDEYKIDLKSYDIESSKKFLKGISLSEIVNKMRAEKYDDA